MRCRLIVGISHTRNHTLATFPANVGPRVAPYILQRITDEDSDGKPATSITSGGNGVSPSENGMKRTTT